MFSYYICMREIKSNRQNRNRRKLLFNLPFIVRNQATRAWPYVRVHLFRSVYTNYFEMKRRNCSNYPLYSLRLKLTINIMFCSIFTHSMKRGSTVDGTRGRRMEGKNERRRERDQKKKFADWKIKGTFASLPPPPLPYSRQIKCI